MGRYYLGLISGTSVDGVDAAICEFGDRHCRVVAAHTFAYPAAIAGRIDTLIGSQQAPLAEIGAVDVVVGRFFADCACALLRNENIDRSDVIAIGHHGQTIFHAPDPPEPFSWQIGDPNSVAAITGIDTVADLRRLDMALGGQGAPLVPAFHEWLFASPTEARVIVNVGGIANLTLLAPGHDVIGFDTGPGNTLLDLWTQRHRGEPYDAGGQWAASGDVDSDLLAAMKQDAYFSRPAPKSTGREYFNSTWIDQQVKTGGPDVDPVNVAATIVELTASTIVDAIANFGLTGYELVVCGGGSKNGSLMRRLGALSGSEPRTTSAYGLDPDFVEAAAMAWLAFARVEQRAGNLPTVTAAREATVLGGLYCGANGG